jgi:hypothetical protein
MENIFFLNVRRNFIYTNSYDEERGFSRNSTNQIQVVMANPAANFFRSYSKQLLIYVIRTKKKIHISDDLLEIARRGKAEFSNSNKFEISFSFMHHTLFCSRLQ